MNQILLQLLNGLVVGSSLALVAAGLALLRLVVREYKTAADPPVLAAAALMTPHARASRARSRRR